jgi:glycogen phosphorylase
LLSGQHGNHRRVAYLSAEFLPGPHLANNLLNLGITEPPARRSPRSATTWTKSSTRRRSPDSATAGLGRLASCYMDSLATLEVPAIGYGIRYEFGIFDQTIVDGWQVEITDKWLRYGNPWEIIRPEIAYEVPFGGHTEMWTDDRPLPRALDSGKQGQGRGLRHPILGYRVGTCNTLRLWKAEAVESFDFAAFNHGDYDRAVEDKRWHRKHHQGALSERRGAPGQGAAAQAAVLFSPVRCRT